MDRFDVQEELADLRRHELMWHSENTDRMEWLTREIHGSKNLNRVIQYVTRIQQELVEAKVSNQKLALALRLRAAAITTLQKNIPKPTERRDVETQTNHTKNNEKMLSVLSPLNESSVLEGTTPSWYRQRPLEGGPLLHDGVVLPVLPPSPLGPQPIRWADLMMTGGIAAVSPLRLE